MKKSLIGATLVAAVASFVSFESAVAQTRPGAGSAPVAAAAHGTNVAVLDVGFVFKNLPRFKDRMESIKTEITKYDEFVATERKTIQGMTEQLKSLKSGTPDFRKTEDDIARRTADLSLQVARKRNDFLKAEAKAYNDQYVELQRAVKAVADANRIDLVIRFSSEQMDPEMRDTVLKGVNRDVVFHRGLDITSPVMQALGYQQATRPVPGPGTR